MATAEREIMLNLTTQHKSGILQGLVVEPVSYTHLDVYKRQLRNMVALGFQQIDLVQIGLLAHFHDSDTEAFSYTHLDVYKRQLLEDTGYMARVAFVMDKLLRRIGLSGRSICLLYTSQ